MMWQRSLKAASYTSKPSGVLPEHNKEWYREKIKANADIRRKTSVKVGVQVNSPNVNPLSYFPPNAFSQLYSPLCCAKNATVCFVCKVHSNCKNTPHIWWEKNRTHALRKKLQSSLISKILKELANSGITWCYFCLFYGKVEELN